MNIHISDNLRKVLDELKKHSVAAKLLLNSDTSSDSNYIDISHTDPYKISYITLDRIKKIKEEYPDSDKKRLKKLIWKKKRYHTKPGKIVKKILGDKVNDKNIEIFSNFYRGLIEKTTSDYKIVKGKDIKTFFHYSTYESMNGTISQSCMRYDESQVLLDFYRYNSNISMLIIFSKHNKNKIIGRSLLWNTVEGYKIMDRIYVVDPHYEYLFYDWARENGYFAKKRNNWYDTINFISPDGKNVELQLSVNLDVSEIKYPYLDTFKWLDVKKNMIYNYLPDIKNKEIRLLMNLDGYWSPHDILLFDGLDRFYRKKESVVYCKYLDIYTRKDRAVKSMINNDYIINQHAKNDNYFGIIFNHKYDDKNNKKKMMKILLDKIVNIYESGDINEYKFIKLKNKFEEIEREQKLVSI